MPLHFPKTARRKLWPAHEESDLGKLACRRSAHKANRSEKTITPWIRRGLLLATNAGPYGNNLLQVRAADLQRVAHGEGEDD
jgi:hypothetical protein